MARNILVMDSAQKLEQEEKEMEPQQESQIAAEQIVSPLHLLLMEVPAEMLLNVLHRLHVGFTLRGDANGKYEMGLHGEGIFKYRVSGARSPKVAIANSLAQFFCSER